MTLRSSILSLNTTRKHLRSTFKCKRNLPADREERKQLAGLDCRTRHRKPNHKLSGPIGHNPILHARLHVCLSACVLVYVLACLLACVFASCSFTFLHACFLAYLRVCLFASFLECLFACLRLCLLAPLLPCLLACLRACLFDGLLVSFFACSFTGLLVCVHF